MMGSPANEPGRQENEAQSTVQITKGFWLCETEMTQGAWRDAMGMAPESNPQHPVTSVSWEDCRSFIAKLPKPYPGWRFDLPTEAQWEYACRAGTQSAFAGDIDSMGWHFENSKARVQAIALKAPNSWGLYDMHGNVFEWCRDSYRERLSEGSNPFVNDKSDNSLRVRRGGSWYYRHSACRSAYRLGDPPDFKTGHLGFRLALVPDGL